MINHESKYLDYCDDIVEKLLKGEKLSVALNISDFNRSLHHAVQSYFSSGVSQRKEIKVVLKKSVDILCTYLIPLDLSKEEISILPIAFEGSNIILISNKISFHEGELPIALLLIKIAIVLDDKPLFKVANLVASFSKIKEDKIKEDTLTFDLENGTIGIALLYQTIYFLTNENVYLQRANYWYVKSEGLLNSFLKANNDVNNQIDEKTISAFDAFKSPEDTIWRKKNFLEYTIFIKKSI